MATVDHVPENCEFESEIESLRISSVCASAQNEYMYIVHSITHDCQQSVVIQIWTIQTFKSRLKLCVQYRLTNYQFGGLRIVR